MFAHRIQQVPLARRTPRGLVLVRHARLAHQSRRHVHRERMVLRLVHVLITSVLEQQATHHGQDCVHYVLLLRLSRRLAHLGSLGHKLAH